jgi:hypothetical protein
VIKSAWTTGNNNNETNIGLRIVEIFLIFMNQSLSRRFINFIFCLNEFEHQNKVLNLYIN